MDLYGVVCNPIIMTKSLKASLVNIFELSWYYDKNSEKIARTLSPRLKWDTPSDATLMTSDGGVGGRVLPCGTREGLI